MRVEGKLTNATIVKDGEYFDILVTFKGSLPNNMDVSYRAPAPFDKLQSVGGSGLPFPNAEVAYSGQNPNCGVAKVTGNQIRVRLLRPNSYYINAGTTLVPPHLYLKFSKHDDLLMIPYLVPHRALTHSKHRTGPEFYFKPDLPARDQATILAENTQKQDMVYFTETLRFWNTRPRH